MLLTTIGILFLKKRVKTYFLRLNFIRIVDLQCCISFCCTSEGISYTYTYIHSFFNSIPIYAIIEYWIEFPVLYIQFSSVAQSCPTLNDPMNRSMPGLPVHHQLPEFTQTYVHRVGDAIQPSHPLSSPSPPASNPSQHQGLFQWVSSSHESAEVLEFQLQHQSFQWTPRTDLL